MPCAGQRARAASARGAHGQRQCLHCIVPVSRWNACIYTVVTCSRVTQAKFENSLKLRLRELDDIIAKNRDNPDVPQLVRHIITSSAVTSSRHMHNPQLQTAAVAAINTQTEENQRLHERLYILEKESLAHRNTVTELRGKLRDLSFKNQSLSQELTGRSARVPTCMKSPVMAVLQDPAAAVVCQGNGAGQQPRDAPHRV